MAVELCGNRKIERSSLRHLRLWRRRGLGGCCSLPTRFFVKRDRMIVLDARHKIPTMYFVREFVTAGGLMIYATNLADANRQIGSIPGAS